MSNELNNMMLNRRVIGGLLLALFCFLPCVSHAQEDMTVMEEPMGMTMPIDSLLADWKSRSYLSIGQDCQTTSVNPTFPDSVYIDRLSRIPTVMELPYNEVVRRYIDRYTGDLRQQVSFMLAAFNFYAPIFEQALEAYGLPLELKYLPIIESALKPTARSRVGASGLWQFMPKTGKLYHLEINSLIDERNDPIKASWAAAHYLYDMYQIYRDWNLVIAAYNCGPGNVNKAIHRAGKSRDYWKIYPFLPRETRGYVPAFIAAAYTMNYYCEHNICPMTTAIPSQTDTLHINKPLHLDQVAQTCNVPLDELKSWNPQYRRNVLPGNIRPYVLRLPDTAVTKFIDLQDTVYTYNKSKYFTKRATVKPGTFATAAKGSYVYHRIRSGETLSTIARKYHVSVTNLKRWNGLRSSSIRAGKKLKIFR